MKSSRKFDLNSLSNGHRDEIDQLLAGIRGDAGATLWTRDMRAAVRGGKCTLVGTSADTSRAD